MKSAFSNKKSVYCQNRKKKKVIEGQNILLENIDKIHTTKLGIDRIRRNLKIETEDVVEYCKNKILMENCNIYKRGKKGASLWEEKMNLPRRKHHWRSPIICKWKR